MSVYWKQFELVATEWEFACCLGVVRAAVELSFDAVFGGFGLLRLTTV